jgi:hypothetical protein
MVDSCPSSWQSRPGISELGMRCSVSDHTPSRNYRWAIYFVVATIHFYRDSIVNPLKAETPNLDLEEFLDENRALLDRVCEESRNFFEYELSHAQIVRGVRAYFAKAQNVAATL